MPDRFTPAERVRSQIIQYTQEMINDDDANIYIAQIYIAALFMKRPEFLYKIFNELGALDATEIWLDEELDNLEATYENSR